MGTIIGANILHKDGTSTHISDIEHVENIEETSRIEFEYHYGPHLLPSEQPSNEGMWRYHQLLPLQYETRRYPLPVGNTPLMGLPGLRQWTGLTSLWIKDETRTPTGSNKDRATALVLEHALQSRIEKVSCASTGNVAVSLAIGAAACGIKAIIFVPASVSASKLKIMRLAGATIFKVIGGYEAAVQLSRRAARTFGWYDRNTGYNPLTLEAKKTVALEIWEQLGRQIPDVIVIPVGDGVTLSGIAKGFRELQLCGAIRRLPRLIGVQAMGCQPLKLAWECNTTAQLVHSTTIADGISVETPINATMALRDIQESAGVFLAVSDEAILKAMQVLASYGGILAEPAGAAAFAGVQEALITGLIKQHETIVVLVTGTLFKTLQYIDALPSGAIYQINANLDEVTTILNKQKQS